MIGIPVSQIHLPIKTGNPRPFVTWIEELNGQALNDRGVGVSVHKGYRRVLDVSGIRKWSNRQITLRVPLAGETARGLTVSVEMEPKPGVTYPEFEGLTPPE